MHTQVTKEESKYPYEMGMKKSGGEEKKQQRSPPLHPTTTNTTPTTKKPQGSTPSEQGQTRSTNLSPLLPPSTLTVQKTSPILIGLPGSGGHGNGTVGYEGGLLDSLHVERSLLNSRTERKKTKVLSIGSSPASGSPRRTPGRTITGNMTPEARAEEERISQAAKQTKNDETIFQIIENELGQIKDWYDQYTNTRDINEQSSKIKKFVSQTAQFLDKTQIVLLRHLLSVTPEREIKPHETPSTKTNRVFKEDPRTMLKHLYKRSEQINDALFDFTQMKMHGPKWEEKLKEILKSLYDLVEMEKKYLFPFMTQLFPSAEEQIAYGTAWSEYLLRAATQPHPTPCNEEINRISFNSGVNPIRLARAFKSQAHI